MDKMTEEYILLFNQITIVLEEMEVIKQQLVDVQKQVEELFIGTCD